MKRVLTLACPIFGMVLGASAATSPLVVTAFPVISPPQAAPQIDATAWVNQSVFQFQDLQFNSIPFQTLNTLYFTNRSSGLMSGQPGFRFEYASGNVRRPMSHWVNEGSISADNLLSFLISTPTLFTQVGSWLLVSATNIHNPGALNGGEISLVRLEGENVNLERAPIRVGPTATNIFFFGGGFIGSSNYFNDPGVIDVYWGEGENNQLGNMGNPLFLPSANFAPPFPSSPIHQVVQPDFLLGFFFTNSVILPTFSFQPYGVFVYTNQFTPTNRFIQMVFVPTNTFDTNITSEVRFFPEFDGGATVSVGFHSRDFDIVTRRTTTNSVFITDGIAGETNVFLARNIAGLTRRPSTFEVTRGPSFFLFGGVTNNATFDPQLIFNQTYLSNSVEVQYAAYAAAVSTAQSTQALLTNAFANPTNLPGRVEIRGRNVNLDRARIRAEATVIIEAENLLTSGVGQVDAPFVNFKLGTDAPALVISNVVPPTVRRLSGQIAAYSATWENTEVLGNTTNQLHFHVLIVDPQFNFNQPVVINELGLRGALVRVEDFLRVGSTFRLQATDVEINGGLILPFGYSLGASNLIGILNFTNNGSINIGGGAVYGADRPNPFESYVNRGTNFASAQIIHSEYFENTGLLVASGGSLTVEADEIVLSGPPPQVVTNLSTNFLFDFVFGTIFTNVTTNVAIVGSSLSGSADVELIGNHLLASNSVISAGSPGQPGKLVLSITNSLADAGPSSTNLWNVSAGFEMRRRPDTGDLLHTHLTSVVDLFRRSDHVWAAEDLGAVPEAFTNNQALGILTVDGGESSFMFFRGTAPGDAMYVDYIELLNTATNIDDSAFLEVDPTLTIYFAHSNVPAEKLHGAADGRFVWVPTYTGPNSSTNLVYPGGSNVVANIALVLSKDRDDDRDGIPNADDDTPVFPPWEMQLELAYAGASGGGGGGGMATLSWNALGLSTNYLECAESIGASEWIVLTNFVQGEMTERVQFNDPVSGSGMRVYRVRQDPR